MKRISRWDIIEDTHSNIHDSKRYLLVSSSNTKKVYGYAIDLATRKIKFTNVSIDRHEEINVLGNLDVANLAIDIIENNTEH